MFLDKALVKNSLRSSQSEIVFSSISCSCTSRTDTHWVGRITCHVSKGQTGQSNHFCPNDGVKLCRKAVQAEILHCCSCFWIKPAVLTVYTCMITQHCRLQAAFGKCLLASYSILLQQTVAESIMWLSHMKHGTCKQACPQAGADACTNGTS